LSSRVCTFRNISILEIDFGIDLAGNLVGIHMQAM